jgi:hypothetical protein
MRFKHAYLFTPFRPIHFTLACDTKQILEHATARARLKLVLFEVSGMVAIFAPHQPLLSHLIFSDGSLPRHCRDSRMSSDLIMEFRESILQFALAHVHPASAWDGTTRQGVRRDRCSASTRQQNRRRVDRLCDRRMESSGSTIADKFPLRPNIRQELPTHRTARNGLAPLHGV